MTATCPAQRRALMRGRGNRTAAGARQTCMTSPSRTARPAGLRRFAALSPAIYSVVVVVLLGLLAGCESRSDTMSAAPADIDQAAAGSAASERKVATDSMDSKPATAPPQRTAGDHASSLANLTPRAVIKTAAIGLESNDVAKVLRQIADAVLAVGGEVSSEQTTTNRKGEAVRSRLVLRVPVDTFDASVANVSSLGRLKSLARSVEDVTADVADIDSRVKSAEDSIAQLRRLFAAAKRLGQIIQLESELSQREADLEALQAQQRALSDQTAMSTIAVTVSSRPRTAAGPLPQQRSGGFIAGLKSGWHALGVSLLAASRVAGLLLPFAVLVLLVAGVAWFVVRRVKPTARPRPSE